MPPKRRVEAAEDKKEIPPAKKTKKEKIKETVNHSEEWLTDWWIEEWIDWLKNDWQDHHCHHVIILNTISKRQDGSDLFRILHTKSFSKFTEASVYYVIAVCWSHGTTLLFPWSCILCMLSWLVYIGSNSLRVCQHNNQVYVFCVTINTESPSSKFLSAVADLHSKILEAHLPSRSNFLHFHAIFDKFWPINMLAPPRKSWS